MSLVNDDATLVTRRAFFGTDNFELEYERIFRRTWQFLAHESEIAEPGDYVTRKLAGEPVIVTRAEDGSVHVLLNSCRHRGAQLCGADLGNASHFRCSYHAWTYRNDGRLTGVPKRREMYGPDFDPARFALVQPPHVRTFCGLVFANWDPAAEPLESALGDMAWYMQVAFGKCEMEVVGPPARLLSEKNWKSGAENYAGDGYHVHSTHQIPIDLGQLSPEPILAKQARAGRPGVPDEEIAKKGTYIYATDRGHGGYIAHMPVRFETTTFLGYEEHLWDEFASNLDERQLAFCSGLSSLTANVFPSFSFIEHTWAYQGDDTEPVNALHMRVWWPISPTRTEVLLFALVPKHASAGWKRDSQTAFLRNWGIAGSLEADDYQNWTGMAQMNTGPVAQALDHDYTGNLTEPDQLPSPGYGHFGSLSDVAFRSLYTEWARLMADEPVRNGNGRGRAASTAGSASAA